MAPGPDAPAITPHRDNAAYQLMLDGGPPTYLEESTPSQPAKRKRTALAEPSPQPALLSPRRSQQNPYTEEQRGLDASIYARPNSTQGSLDNLISSLEKRNNITIKTLRRLSQAIEEIISTSEQDEQGIALELLGGIPEYLSSTLQNGTQDKQAQTNNTKTWATTATAATPSQPQPNPRAHTTTTAAAATPQPPEDLRVLVRVPKEHQEWAKSLRNYALREATCKALGLTLAQIPDIHHTATGFSIRSIDKTTRDIIVTKEEQLRHCLRASKVELPTKWYTYIIPNCPTELPNILGEPTDIEPALEDEITAQTGTRPVRILPSKHATERPNKKTWIVSFLRPVEPFRLFNASTTARRIERKTQIIRHNPGCQGYHPNRYCPRRSRCENCSETIEEGQHHPEPCNLSPRCANCYGPFPASHENCPAKPTKKNGTTTRLTGTELKAIRKIGQKSYRKTNANDHTTSTQSTGGQTASQTASQQAGQATKPHSHQPSQQDEMEFEMQANLDQQLEQQFDRDSETDLPPLPSNAGNQRQRRNIPRKDYSLANAYTNSTHENQPSSEW